MEVTGTQEAFEIRDPADVGAVRRRASLIAAECGFSEARVGEVALVVTEAATNVCKHAREGWMVLGRISCDDETGITVAAIDAGPGMDVERCIVDGMSTRGTPGLGLGAIRRLASSWDAFSAPGNGTVLTSTLWRDKTRAPQRGGFALGAVAVPYPGEMVSGDAWAAAEDDGGFVSLIVIDGLGHGPAAAEASKAVLEAFLEHPFEAPRRLLERSHAAARPTRGAAASIAQIDPKSRTVVFAGSGNVQGWLWDPERDALRPMLSQHGTLGHALARPREERYVLPEGGLVTLHSDGLKSRIGLSQYTGFARRSADTIAALLWRDYARGRDDATVVVACDREVEQGR